MSIAFRNVLNFDPVSCKLFYWTGASSFRNETHSEIMIKATVIFFVPARELEKFLQPSHPPRHINDVLKVSSDSWTMYHHTLFWHSKKSLKILQDVLWASYGDEGKKEDSGNSGDKTGVSPPSNQSPSTKGLMHTKSQGLINLHVSIFLPRFYDCPLHSSVSR